MRKNQKVKMYANRKEVNNMDKTLLSREELSQRWGVNIRTIIKYEQEGIITRNPNIPTPRYNLS